MKLVLSRFAAVYREGAALVIDAETGPPLALAEPAALALLAALTEPRTLAEAAERAGVSEERAHAIADPLVVRGALVDAETAADEARSPWTMPERLVHARSRRPWRTRQPGNPPPALAPVPWTPTIDLPRPDIDALEAGDAPFAAVQEARRSLRHYSAEPLSVAALGEFLFRTGRVADLRPLDHTLEMAARPYPSAGGLYELELLPLVGACDGLAPGLYHYAAAHHALALVAERSEVVEELRTHAAAAMGGAALPQVLVLVGGRMDRLAWKYESLSYSLMLKDSGVLMQTMYLTATAMGLAGCAVGGGDGELFASATGVDADTLAPVGEFCLGRPDGPVS